jgi:hypothetical protein
MVMNEITAVQAKHTAKINPWNNEQYYRTEIMKCIEESCNHGQTSILYFYGAHEPMPQSMVDWLISLGYAVVLQKVYQKQTRYSIDWLEGGTVAGYYAWNDQTQTVEKIK